MIMSEVVSMIATLEYVNILDRAEELGHHLLQCDVFILYKEAKQALQENEKAQQLIRNFVALKEDYNEVQRFGRYHPDYYDIMKKVRAAKRQMDLNEQVAAYKIAERNLQDLLDEVSEQIAFSVSEKIKVPRDQAFLSDGQCGGDGCGSGGTCSCQAS